MINKITSLQIPRVWDVIKFSLSKVEGLTDKISEDRYNFIFAELLNDRAQCFIRVSDDEDRLIKALMITEIIVHPLTKVKNLKIICLYAFGINHTDEWKQDYGFLENFAKSIKCQEVLFESSNLRVIKLAKDLGFNEKFTTFGYFIGA
jgi:hypothetical protein